ncbi:MAG: NAD(P)-binding domain-containing protein, partial [Dehalococcoidia bacterium]|nr:NAD(P)-binding domain-containing protein [Dehalococcoidia bacterium]
MARIYYDKDADMSLLRDRTIGIIGFGSQGHAHAQNLRDSGCRVIVAEAPGTSGWKNAQVAGFKVAMATDVAAEASVIAMLVPDNLQPAIYRESIEQALTPGKMLMFAHGFNIHFGQIVPPPGVDVTMVAPKAPGRMVRELYLQGSGVPALIAVEKDATGKAKA